MNALLDSVMASCGGGQKSARRQALRALAWARVSTDMQEERGQSMPEQLRQIREYAEKHGIEIVEEYREAASAFKKESLRVEFHKMVARAKSDRDIDAILVHDYSRFSRDSLGARMLVRELSKSGVRVISLNDVEVDTESVAGVYMEAITFAKNEAYSREVAFHTKKGCRANVQTRDPETGWCYKNGGQPLWGYKSQRLIRGEEKKGRPLFKSIWVPDDTIVAGKPVHEWAKYILTEMAASGDSLDRIRDFCNERGIPAPRAQYWGTSTWHSLLHPNCLLQYAGYGVWNVRGKSQRMNPAAEWVIVENAQPALITEEEAQAIMAVRERQSAKHTSETGAQARSKGSRFLLSGGLFKCARCGANMAGFRSQNGKGRNGFYYVCGSAQYRRTLGCGPGVFVDQNVMEEAVFEEIDGQFGEWCDDKAFAAKVGALVQETQKAQVSDTSELKARIVAIDEKIVNLRKAIEGGLDDVGWANTRMRELTLQREELSSKITPDLRAVELPRLDVAMVKAYRNNFDSVLPTGTNGEQREFIRGLVDSIVLVPAEDAHKANEPAVHEIRLNLRTMPAMFVKGMGAGRGFEPLTFGL